MKPLIRDMLYWPDVAGGSASFLAARSDSLASRALDAGISVGRLVHVVIVPVPAMLLP